MTTSHVSPSEDNDTVVNTTICLYSDLPPVYNTWRRIPPLQGNKTREDSAFIVIYRKYRGIHNFVRIEPRGMQWAAHTTGKNRVSNSNKPETPPNRHLQENFGKLSITFLSYITSMKPISLSKNDAIKIFSIFYLMKTILFGNPQFLHR